MSFSYFFTLFMLAGGLFGGGNDLLDYVPSQSYWALKATPLTFESMAAQVREPDPAVVAQLAKSFEAAIGKDRDNLASALIAQGDAALNDLKRLSGSKDRVLADQAKGCVLAIESAPKGANVRRLMAIRTLGAMGKKEALPLLQPLLKSRAPFVAEYAADAIASLQARPATTRPSAAGSANDVWRLPAECRAVARLAPRVVPPGLADGVVRHMRLPEAPEEQGGSPAVDRFTFLLVRIADKFGNIRFDGITLGASGDLGPDSGFVIAVVRGRYDHAAVNRALSADRTPYNDVPAGRVFVPGGAALMAVSDDLLIFAASPGGTPPVDRVVAAVADPARPGKAGAAAVAGAPAAGLRSSPDMVKLIGSVDTSQPLWAAAKVTDAYRRLPALEPFDTLTFTARPAAAGTLDLRLDAHGTNPAKVKAATDAAAAQLAQLRRAIPDDKPAADPGGAAAAPDPFDPLASLRAAARGLLDTAKLSASGGNLAGAARVTVSRVEVFRFLLASMKDAPKGIGTE